MSEPGIEMANLQDDDDDGRHADVDQPLMAGDDEQQDGPYSIKHTQHRAPLHRAGKVVWLLTLSAGLSGLLFGYDTGVISSTLISIGTDLSHRQLTTTDKSLITAITSLFALLAAPVTGFLADKYGRRFVILVANILFIFGAIAQAFATVVPVMVVGRAAVGAAVGLASCATPLYITELAPAEMRGRLVTIQSLFITGGQVVAYLIGWAFAQTKGGWRWMVGLGAVPALVQLCLLAVMFETPRWLVQAGRIERAEIVLQKVYGGLPEDQRQRTVDSVLSDIQNEVASEAKLNPIATSSFTTTARHLFLHAPSRRALTLACMLQATQQLCGFNSLMYFSGSIFTLLGFRNPIATSLSIALTNFAFTLAAFAFIDTLGRRRILLSSIPIMVIALSLCSYAFYQIVDLPPGTNQSSMWLVHDDHSRYPGTLLGALILYVAAYAIGLGCVPWQQSELFPLRVRSLGSAIATATNWSSNFVIGITFLPMMEFLSPSVTFAVYAIVCVVGWVGIWTIYPETAGLELEGVGELLKDGFGVKESLEGFRQRKRGRDGG